MLLHLLLGILIVVAVSLTAIILFQRSEGGALGMGGGGGQFMSARGASDLLTRTTQILAGIFFVLCLTITILSGRASGVSSVVDRVTINKLNPNDLNKPAEPAGITAPAPTVGTVPAGQPVDLGLPAPQTAPVSGFGAPAAPAPATAPQP